MSTKSAKQIVEMMERSRTAEIERMADEVMRANDYRENQATHVPLIRRGRRIHRVPKTALIALAAQRKYLKRQVLQLVHWRVESQPEDLPSCIQDLKFVRDYLGLCSTLDVPRSTKGDQCTQLSQ